MLLAMQLISGDWAMRVSAVLWCVGLVFAMGCSDSDDPEPPAAQDAGPMADSILPDAGPEPSDAGEPDAADPEEDAGGADGGNTMNGEWELVWADEFEGNGIDPQKWQHEVNCWGGGNNEDQCYVADGKNSFVQDGSLHIVTLSDQPSGPVGGPGNDANIVQKGHSSARLVGQGLAQWTYGRMEARAKLPCGQGLWPAIWMMPADSEYGGWAASGEIDIMEAVNLDCAADTHEVHGTLHYGSSWPDNLHTSTHTTTASSAVTDFHEYAVEWEPGVIRWFVDGVHFATQSNWCSSAAPYPAPFDRDFFFILNIAVGGEWPGPPNPSTTFPQEMEVDYVRVYQCEGDTGCGTADPAITPLDPLSECNTERVTTDETELWLYRDGINHNDWPGGNSWQENPGKVVHNDLDDDGDTVWQIRWTDVAGGGNLYIQSVEGRQWDLRNFRENGRLAFDIKAVSLGDATALYTKADSTWPALGQVDIFDQLQLGEWVGISIPIESLVANPGDAPLDLGSIFTPFVLEPNWAASNIELHVDDIRWVRD
jgi:beta-glucanase (GH16 family)